MNIKFILILFLATLIACNQNRNEDNLEDNYIEEPQEELTTYTNNEYNFSIIVPEGFEYYDDFPNSELLIIRNQLSNPDPTNLTLTITKVNGDLNKYYEGHKNELESSLTNAEIVFEEKTKISSYVCYLMDLEFKREQDLMHCRLFTFLEDEKAFHFSLISKKSEFEEDVVEFTRILESIRID